jgi:hypothetical protein
MVKEIPSLIHGLQMTKQIHREASEDIKQRKHMVYTEITPLHMATHLHVGI